MSSMALRLGALCCLLTSGARAQEAAPQVASFDDVRTIVLPTDDETAWKRLGWRASLWAGVVEGQALEKPILLWAMNGHPLGCT